MAEINVERERQSKAPDSDDNESSIYSDSEEENEGMEEEGSDSDSSTDSRFDVVDSSDEEDLRNTIGNIPFKWYSEFDHVGYDAEGKKIAKPEQKSEIDEFLARMDDPNYWKTVKDRQTGADVVLTDDQVASISNIQGARYHDGTYNPYQPFVDFFTYEVMKHPVSNRPEHKRSFIPSKLEKEKVGKLVHAIKMGWIKPRKPKQLQDEEPKFYDIWASDDQDAKSKSQLARLKMHIPAPKMKLPGNAESYNPPAEYLFSKQEQEKWNEQEPYERKHNFVPEKYDCMRYVPAYANFIKERFERCLDLYLAPRQRKMRLNVDPEDLLPKLPKPEELRPFPTTQSIIYKGHTGAVRSVVVEQKGQFIASAADDKTVRVWEVATGRCLKTVRCPAAVDCISWCPSSSMCLLAVATGSSVFLVNPGVGDKLISSDTDTVLNAIHKNVPTKPDSEADTVAWSFAELKKQSSGLRVILEHPKPVKYVTWHAKGDYFASVCPDGGNLSVFVHQLSKWRSQCPFTKSKGRVSQVLFHPTRPLFFVASERHIRLYNLAKQELAKKLIGSCQQISSMALHPSGDHVIAGSFDPRLHWFDLDLSVKPYKTLRHQKQPIRGVAVHPHYPLFASCSDDGTTVVCHGRVYSDLMQNPLIVPVKVLRGHSVTDSCGVLSCAFHPIQPWIFTAGADATIRLFT